MLIKLQKAEAKLQGVAHTNNIRKELEERKEKTSAQK